MKRHISLLIYILFLSINTYAISHLQTDSIVPIEKDSILNKLTDIDRQVKNFIRKDTLRGYSTPRRVETESFFKPIIAADSVKRDRNGLIIQPFEYQPFLSYMNFTDTIIINPLMLPTVFDGKILPDDLDFRKDTSIIKRQVNQHMLVDRDSIIAPPLYSYNQKSNNSYKLIDKNSTLSPELWTTDRVNFMRKSYYTAHPERIKSNALAFTEAPIIQRKVEQKSPFKDLISTEDAIEIAKPTVSKIEIKQVYWKFWGEHELKVAQKAYSGNWSPATDDNFQLQNYHKFTAQYKKGKIKLDHWTEWRFNAQYTKLPSLPEGTVDNRTNFLINDDWIKTYNRLGLDAFIKKWSYILTLDIKTPLFRKKAQNNKDDILAALFSPLDVNFGIGAGYALEWKSATNKDRKFKLTIDATPLSFDLKHIASDKVWEKHKYGVVYEDEEGDENKEPEDRKSAQRRYTKTEIGSTINSNIFYSFNSYTTINSRIKYFTNYERSYLECENTLNFQLNRYLATSLYVYMKYDDSSTENRHKHDLGYFSFNEVLGFGLSYRW